MKLVISKEVITKLSDMQMKKMIGGAAAYQDSATGMSCASDSCHSAVNMGPNSCCDNSCQCTPMKQQG